MVYNNKEINIGDIYVSNKNQNPFYEPIYAEIIDLKKFNDRWYIKYAFGNIVHGVFIRHTYINISPDDDLDSFLKRYNVLEKFSNEYKETNVTNAIEYIEI